LETPANRLARWLHRQVAGNPIRDVYDKEAKDRQKAHLKRGDKKPVQEKLPELDRGRARVRLAW